MIRNKALMGAGAVLIAALSLCITLGGLVLRRAIDSSQVILNERVMDFYMEDS
jgi:hypothetical protein